MFGRRFTAVAVGGGGWSATEDLPGQGESWRRVGPIVPTLADAKRLAGMAALGFGEDVLRALGSGKGRLEREQSRRDFDATIELGVRCQVGRRVRFLGSRHADCPIPVGSEGEVLLVAGGVFVEWDNLDRSLAMIPGDRWEVVG